MSDPPPPSSRNCNVVLVGFMGAGKSSVARLVARSLGFACVDTDELVVAMAGMPIARLFEERGEDEFRALESAVLADLAHRDRLVISTGGGIVVRAENRPLLRALGFVVWLSASVATTFERVSLNANRPLLRVADPVAKIGELMDARAGFYREVADLHVDTTGLTMDEIAYGVGESARVTLAGAGRNPSRD